LTIEINLLKFNPKYPKHPSTLGEKIRKVRMDKGLQIKESAEMFGVTEYTVINWEIRGIKPRRKYQKKIRKVLNINL